MSALPAVQPLPPATPTTPTALTLPTATTPASPRPRRAWPSPAWHAELTRQATVTVIAAAVRTAQAEIGRLRRLIPDVALEPEDLVQDLLTATAAGTLTWSPDVVPLLTHLRDKVRLACRRLRRRLRARHDVKEIALDGLRAEDPVWSEVEEALATEVAPRDATSHEPCRRLVTELRTLAAGDLLVARVFEEMASGTLANAEIAEAIAIPVPAVERAKKRLRRLARQVSPELREEISAGM